MYRLSHALVLEVLRAKVEALAQAADGIFGPLESTQLGEESKPAPPSEGAATSVEGETDTALPQAAKRFSTVSRGLAKEGAGSGHGLSEELQNGASLSSLALFAPAVSLDDHIAHSAPGLPQRAGNGTRSASLPTTFLPSSRKTSSRPIRASSFPASSTMDTD